MNSPPSSGGVNKEQWKFKSIKWGKVWRRQDHASLIFLLIILIALSLVSFLVDPRDDNYFIYDATISQPSTGKHGFDPTVPNWAAIVIPLLLMIATLVVGEFIYSRKQHRAITDAVAVIIYFLFDALQSLACTLLVVQASKMAVGGLRPDFLVRCNPIPPNTVTIQFGQNTADLYPCTNPDQGVINEGRLSFPSGHAATAFNLSVYASGYLIWCWNMRRPSSPRSLGPKAEFLGDVWNVVAKLWMLVMLALAWGIAMSRIIDNQHHPVDVVAGMLLGSLIAGMYVLRAVPRYAKVLTAPLSAEEERKKMEAAVGGGELMGGGGVGSNSSSSEHQDTTEGISTEV